MSADELRDAIYDYLFSERGPKTVDEIAAVANKDTDTIRGVVNHEWFTVVGERVSIAYVAAGTGVSRR